MKLFFCADGVLRLYADEHTPMLPCTFIQEEMDMVGEDFAFFSRFLDKEATFEKGLTFQGFLRCISPWADFWSMYSQVNLDSYLSFTNRPYLAKSKPYIDSIEFSTFVSVDSGLAYLIDNKLVRAEDMGFLSENFGHKFEPTLALGASFNIQNMFYIRGYSDRVEHFSFDITNTPVYEYMYAPLTLRKRTNVIFSEEGSKSLLEMRGKSGKKQVKSSTLVFSKDLPGFQRLVTGDAFEDDSFSYVEGDHCFSLEEIMREIFRYMPPEAITSSNKYSEIIHSAFDAISEYEDVYSQEQLSELMSNIIDDFWDQEIKEYEEKMNSEIQKEAPAKSAKVTTMAPQQSKNLKDNTFDNVTIKEKDSKVLSLQDFREKKENEKNHNDEHINPKHEDHMVLLMMVEEAKKQNIPLKQAFDIAQNHQPQNRVLGILQEPALETFDPLSFLEKDKND